MNCHFAIAIVLATSAAAVTAFADDISMEPVRSEADLWAEQYNVQIGLARPGRTRAEATAEYIAERDQVAAFNGEDSGSSYLAQQAQPRSEAIRLAGASE